MAERPAFDGQAGRLNLENAPAHAGAFAFNAANRGSPNMTFLQGRSLAGALAAVLLAACAAAPRQRPMLPVATMTDFSYPASTARIRTTDPAIFMGNLDARIDAHQKRLATQESAPHRAALAGALNHRFRIVGRIQDGEAALMHLERALAIEPDHADALLAHASTLSAFHQFDDAERALARARTLNADAGALTRIERDLKVARGEYAALSDDFARSREPVGDFYELAHRADLRVLQGDLDGATHWYRAAQNLYADVDPMPLAWLHTQQGIALLRHGQFAQAKPFFQAAHERLPQYALATEHLAECEFELGHYASARMLYRAVIDQTANPEFIAALADVEAADGHRELARSLRAEAQSGYEQLLERHPAAYAQHAAEFLLDMGQSARALTLARENLVLRKDIGSWILLARSAAAANELAEACAANRQARGTGLKPPELAQLDELEKRCGTSANRLQH